MKILDFTATTKRWCATCEKYTTFRYDKVIGHSRCEKCDGYKAYSKIPDKKMDEIKEEVKKGIALYMQDSKEIRISRIRTDKQQNMQFITLKNVPGIISINLPLNLSFEAAGQTITIRKNKKNKVGEKNEKDKE